MENFALVSLVEELQNAARGMVVRRVVAYHARGILLQTRSVRMPALKITLAPRNPAIYISAARPPIDPVTGDFLMALRKHLASARLTGILKPLAERIVELRFKTALPARELETVHLVVELIPNSPNLFLLDAERRILASFRPPAASRELAAYEEYRHPASRKTDLAALDDEATWFNAEEFANDRRGWLTRNLAGVGPVFAAELVHRQEASGRTLPEELRLMLARLTRPTRTAWLYSEKALSVLSERGDLEALGRSIPSPVELESLARTHSVHTYPGMLEATRALYDLLEDRTLLERAKAPRLRKLRDRKRRLAEQHARLLDRRKRFEDTRGLQETAQMLVSSGADLDQRRPSVEVTDYTLDSPAPRRVELDPARTLRENADAMFRKHRKAGRGIKIVEEQLLRLGDAEARIEREEQRVRAVTDWNAWGAIGGDGPSNGNRARIEGSPPDRTTRSRNGRSVVMDGREILIGRNGRENDDLTFRVAESDDFWLHAADYSGSHVIVRNPSREPELEASLLERAAQLAAYYSQARNSHKVSVHYTRRKYVKKPRKAKPGLVLLKEFRTITVEPKNWVAP